MKSVAAVLSHAVIISSLDALGFAKSILFFTVSSKSTTS